MVEPQKKERKKGEAAEGTQRRGSHREKKREAKFEGLERVRNVHPTQKKKRKMKATEVVCVFLQRPLCLGNQSTIGLI